MKHSITVLVVGPAKSGKSTVCKKIERALLDLPKRFDVRVCEELSFMPNAKLSYPEQAQNS